LSWSLYITVHVKLVVQVILSTNVQSEYVIHETQNVQAGDLIVVENIQLVSQVTTEAKLY
jgi:hypothetical protein